LFIRNKPTSISLPGVLSAFSHRTTLEMNNHGCYRPQAELLFFWISVHSQRDSRTKRAPDLSAAPVLGHPSPSSICSLMRLNTFWSIKPVLIAWRILLCT